MPPGSAPPSAQSALRDWEIVPVTNHLRTDSNASACSQVVRNFTELGGAFQGFLRAFLARFDGRQRGESCPTRSCLAGVKIGLIQSERKPIQDMTEWLERSVGLIEVRRWLTKCLSRAEDSGRVWCAGKPWQL